MNSETRTPSDAQRLRKQAELQLHDTTRRAPDDLETLAAQRVIRELRVNRIELELQVEELTALRAETESAIDRYDFAPAGFLTLLPSGEIREINLAGATMLGGSRTAMVGVRLGAMVVLPELPELSDFLRRVFGTNRKQTHVCTIMRPNKTRLRVLIAATTAPSGNECRAVVVDISDRAPMPVAARRTDAESPRLENAVRSAGYGIWEYDIATQRLFWDEQMFEVYGVPRAGFDGTADSWRRRVYPEDLAIADGMFTRLRAGEALKPFEFRIIHGALGEVRWIEASAAAQLDGRGHIERLVGINRDVTGRNAATARGDAARLRAEADSRGKGEFLGDICDRIRTPMTALLGYAELLTGGTQGRMTPEQQAEYLAMIVRSGQQMMGFVSEVLDVTRTAPGGLSGNDLQTLRESFLPTATMPTSLHPRVPAANGESPTTMRPEAADKPVLPAPVLPGKAVKRSAKPRKSSVRSGKKQ